MKKSTRILSLVLAALLLFSSACMAEAAGKSWQKDTSPVTLELFMNASWWSDVWDTPTAARMTAESGVTLNVTTPVADDNQRLILMINNGELPDMICTEVGNPCNEMLIDSGLVWDIDELVDTYAPELRETADPAVFTDNKWSDGHTYYWTNFTDSDQYHALQSEYNKLVTSNQRCICVRKDYWEEIGSPKMDTPEAFYDALVKMHEKHPDKIGYYQGDGLMSGSSSTSMGDLGIYFGINSYYSDAEGNIKLWPRTEQFKECVLFYNKLATAGILTRDSFIDDSNVAMSRVMNAEPIAYGWTVNEVNDAGENAEYIVLDPWDSYKVIRTGGGWQTTFISKTGNAERAIQLINYMLDPDVYSQFGVRGNKEDPYLNDTDGPHYYMDEEGWPHYTAAYQAMLADGSANRSTSGAGVYFFFNSSALANVLYWEKEEDPEYDHYNEVFGPHIEYHEEYASSVIKPAVDSDEGVILSKFSSVFNSYLVDIVFAENEEAALAGIDALNKAMDDMGCAKLEDYYTTHVREFLAR